MVESVNNNLGYEYRRLFCFGCKNCIKKSENSSIYRNFGFMNHFGNLKKKLLDLFG